MTNHSLLPLLSATLPVQGTIVERVRDEARRIERTFRFRNFGEAFALVQQVGELAEAEGHHPDISFGWGYVTVVMQTKKIKGLHENDFIMAAKIDRLSEPVVLPSIGP